MPQTHSLPVTRGKYIPRISKAALRVTKKIQPKKVWHRNEKPTNGRLESR